MEGTLKVTPDQLISTASSLSSSGTTITNLTTAMTELANGLTSVWTGEAATEYTAKFNGLQDDMARINAKIQEHVKDLNEMAQIYSRSTTDVSSVVSGLSRDAIS